MVPQLLVSALQCTAQMHAGNIRVEQGRMQLRALEMQLDQQNSLADMRVSLVRDMIHALIERRMEAIQAGFTQIISAYAEQSRGYMSQQEKLTEASFRVTDPLERAHYDARLSEIDGHLSRIRTDALCLYQEMNRTLCLIGETMPLMPHDDQHVLRLT